MFHFLIFFLTKILLSADINKLFIGKLVNYIVSSKEFSYK